jgi:hypothetical protein
MKFKTISSKAIIAKVYRDIKPNNNAWVIDAFEWLYEVLSNVGFTGSTERKAFCIKVTGHKGKLPCNYEDILGFQYKGQKLPLISSINATRNTYKNNEVNWYSINPDYIQTSFESGDVTMYGMALVTDEEGYPLIPDLPNVKEACLWYIVYRMILGGYKHHAIDLKTAFEMYDKTYMPRAQNELKMPTLDQAIRFKQRWTAICNSFNYENVFFDEYSSKGRSATADNILMPTESINTITRVEDTDDNDLELSTDL